VEANGGFFVIYVPSAKLGGNRNLVGMLYASGNNHQSVGSIIIERVKYLHALPVVVNREGVVNSRFCFSFSKFACDLRGIWVDMVKNINPVKWCDGVFEGSVFWFWNAVGAI